MIKNFINRIIFSEQTIQTSGGVQEIDLSQGFLSKEAERENMNLKGFYKNEAGITKKPSIEEIKDLNKQKAAIEKEIKQNQELKIEDSLFSTSVLRKGLGKRSKHEMRNDLIKVSEQLDDLKNKSKENDKYRKNLKIVLRKFFTLGKFSSRYIFLPLSAQTPTDNILKLMNTSENGKQHMFDFMRQNKEILKDVLDKEIIEYMKAHGYSFKNEKDIYDNICYTKNGAKINLHDELKKIGANVKNIESKKNILKKMDPKNANYKSIEEEIAKLSSYKPLYAERMESIVENSIDDSDIKNLKVVVLTWVPRQIMTQSTGTIWRSCMSMSHVDNDYNPGSNVRYVASGIQEGVFIAWLVNFNDIKTIKEPIARILIKPFFTEDDEMIWWPSTIYHDGRGGQELNLFKRTCVNYMLKKQNSFFNKNKIRIKVKENVYSDNDDHEIIFYKPEEEVYISPDNFIKAVNIDLEKIIIYLKNIHPSDLDWTHFQTKAFFIYLLNLNNFTIIKMFFDLLIKNLREYFNAKSKYKILGVIEAFKENYSVNTDKYFLYFLENVFFIKEEMLDYCANESLSLFIKLLNDKKFMSMNKFFEKVDRLTKFFKILEIFHLLYSNIKNNNKLSFPYLKKTMENTWVTQEVAYLYLASRDKNVKNFLDLYFKDNFKEIKEILVDVKMDDIRRRFFSKTGDESLKRSMVLKLFQFMDEEKTIPDDFDFVELIDFKYDFIDDETADALLKSGTFNKIQFTDPTEMLQGLKYDTNPKFLSAYLDKMIKISDEDDTNKIIYQFIHKSVWERNQTEKLMTLVSKIEKSGIKINRAMDLVYDFLERVEYGDLEKSFLNDFVKIIFKNQSEKSKKENDYNAYFMLLMINEKSAEKYLKENNLKEKDFAKNFHLSDFRFYFLKTISYAYLFFNNEDDFEKFLYRHKDLFDQILKKKEYSSLFISDVIRKTSFNRVFLIFYVKNYKHYSSFINFVDFSIRVRYFFDQLDYVKPLSTFDRIEKEAYLLLKEIALRNNSENEFNAEKINVDFLKNYLDKDSIRRTVFIFRIVFPTLDLFFSSEMFSKIIKKINAITKTNEAYVANINFFQYLVVAYETKIDINLIPKNIIKIIEKHKDLKKDLEASKKE